MIPLISHFESFEDQYFWVTTDGVLGAAFELSFVDLETQDALSTFQQIRQALKRIDPRVLLRFKVSVSSPKSFPHDLPRSKALEILNVRSYRVLLIIDYVGGFDLLKEFIKRRRKRSFQQEILTILQAVKLFEGAGLSLLPLSEEEMTKLLPTVFRHWRTGLTSIETGTESIGLLRLEKMPFEYFEMINIVKVLEGLPQPASICLSLQRIDEASARLFLERKLKQTLSGRDAASALQADETLSSLKETLKAGGQLFTAEYLVELRRRSEELLSRDLDTAGNLLQSFGETYLETFGVAPSFCATLPGNQQHVTFFELDEGAAGLLPVFARRESAGDVIPASINPRRALTLMRADRSLYHFDLFNTQYTASNALIVGASGRGKSVLMGLLTWSLLNDPNVCIIKLDVGGSHSKECELFGGQEYQLSLKKGAGINPFEVLSVATASDADKVGILARFLGSLIIEEKEESLSKTLRGDIEAHVQAYLDSKSETPSLEDFYQRSLDFPRRDLLRRWVKGGLYGKVFSGDERIQANTQLNYFNLQEIFNAADPDFSRAAIAAILCFFNTEVLKDHGKRIVLICDEVPFFIKTNFEFFKFTTANVRKFGHATVLSAQLSSDFVVRGDTGIIENSPQRFLFTVDGEEEVYRQRFGLSPEHIRIIQELQAVPGRFSEVVGVECGGKVRRLKIQVTPEEYWRLTTSRADKDKLLALMGAVPGLSLQEAINCLSVER